MCKNYVASFKGEGSKQKSRRNIAGTLQLEDPREKPFLLYDFPTRILFHQDSRAETSNLIFSLSLLSQGLPKDTGWYGVYRAMLPIASWGWGYSSVAECCPSMHETLGCLIPSTS